jgi:hypothetical protein
MQFSNRFDVKPIISLIITIIRQNASPEGRLTSWFLEKMPSMARKEEKLSLQYKI